MANASNVKSDGNQSENNNIIIKSEEQDMDLMSMFASAWIKVEVDGSEEEEHKEERRYIMADELSVKREDNNIIIKSEAQDMGMMTMFASAWVKNEVVGSEEEEHKEEIRNIMADELSVKRDGDQSKDNNIIIKSEEQDTDMMSMFASAWVKNEVNGFEEKKHKEERRSKRKKHQRRKASIVLNCTLCKYTTKYPTCLQRHVTIKHQSKETLLTEEEKNSMTLLKCDKCEYTTHLKWYLNDHKRKHNLGKRFKCPHCNYETAFRKNYLNHSKVHNERVVYKCNKCPFVTKFEGHINFHLSKKHNETTEEANKCNFCDFSTTVWRRLNIHKQRSRQENPIQCEHCEFQTVYMCESKKHKVTHYNKIYGSGIHNRIENLEEKSDYISRECIERQETQTENQYILDPNCLDWNSIQVLESDDKDKPFMCHMCSYTSKSKWAVQTHFLRQHTGSQNRPYKCVNCDFSTKTKEQVTSHIKRSQADKVLYCGMCSFTTNFKCQLVMHQKGHYAYKCTVCPYSCRHKYELQKHFTALHSR